MRPAPGNTLRGSTKAAPPAFLNACDEMGLLVLEEIPGWQNIGENRWQDLSVDNVGHDPPRLEPSFDSSIVLWGVRTASRPTITRSTPAPMSWRTRSTIRGRPGESATVMTPN